MILDTAANAERLKHVHPGSGPRSSICEGRTWLDLPEGRQEIDGSRLYAIVIRGQGKGLKGAKLEIHRRYIDIQCSITGSDVIGWKPTASCLIPSRPTTNRRISSSSETQRIPG